jgi:hypothetical protein
MPIFIGLVVIRASPDPQKPAPVWAIASGIGGKADIAHWGGHVAV